MIRTTTLAALLVLAGPVTAQIFPEQKARFYGNTVACEATTFRFKASALGNGYAQASCTCTKQPVGECTGTGVAKPNPIPRSVPAEPPEASQ